MQKESKLRPALILGDKSWHNITEDVCRPTESKPPPFICFALNRPANIFSDVMP